MTALVTQHRALAARAGHSSVVTGPLMSTFADRFPKRAVMIAADLVRVVLVVVAAGVIAVDGPALVVYGLALVTSVIGAAFRPAQAALLPVLADEPKKAPEPFKGLKLRNIGPAAGGRVSRACGVPGDPFTYYAATAAGGVWKSSDGGFTWSLGIGFNF